MILYVSALIWFGGVTGMIDAGKNMFTAITWPFHVTKALVIWAVSDSGKADET